VSNLPSILPQKRVETPLVIAGIIIAVAALGALGPLFCAGSVYTYVRLKRRGYGAITGLLVCGVLGGFGYALAWPVLVAQYETVLIRDEVVVPILILWSFAIPLFPLGGVAMDLGGKAIDLFRAKTIDEAVEDEKRAMERRDQAAGKYAARRGKYPPEPVRGTLTLGTTIQPGFFPAYAGITQQSGWLQIAEGLFDQHMSIPAHEHYWGDGLWQD
jgi:hypothetical protein